MGNTLGKREEEVVDGGFVFPTGVVYQKNDCDLRIVRKLILDTRLAPFYKGVNDAPEPSAMECPICFLYYPSNMNYSRCCNQPICTECFSQIHQPKTGGPALCPFCQLPDFGVTYVSPSQNPEGKSKGKFDPLPVDSSFVISIDQIRPNGRHYPPPSDPEPVRRRTISGRPSGNRPSARRATQISSSFNPDPLYGNHSMRIQASNRYTAREVEAEIENLMLMEAIQLSLMEMEQQRKHKQEIRAAPSSASPPSSPFSAQRGESSSSYRSRTLSASSSSSSSSSSDASHPDSLL